MFYPCTHTLSSLILVIHPLNILVIHPLSFLLLLLLIAGALCPGGFRAWPLPGYWSGDQTSPDISVCTPPSPKARCVGWDIERSRTSCGAVYRPGSYLCESCAEGAYATDDGGCVLCPLDLGPWAQYSGILICTLTRSQSRSSSGSVPPSQSASLTPSVTASDSADRERCLWPKGCRPAPLASSTPTAGYGAPLASSTPIPRLGHQTRILRLRIRHASFYDGCGGGR